MQRTYIYQVFERFWHWCQALLVILLALTGFDMHYHWGIWPFEGAIFWHKAFAWAFVVLIVFAIFWHLTTGEWKQYVPGRGNVISQAMYYLFGIFKNEPHPTQKTKLSKLNPLQQVAYLVLKILVIPVQVLTGFLYYYWNNWDAIGIGHWQLETMALIHTIGAFALIAFMILHVYLTTTGHTPLSNVRAMITGWEEIEKDSGELT